MQPQEIPPVAPPRSETTIKTWQILVPPDPHNGCEAKNANIRWHITWIEASVW